MLWQNSMDNKLVQCNLCLQNNLAHIGVFPRVIYEPWQLPLPYILKLQDIHLTIKIKPKCASCLPRTGFTPASGKPYSGGLDTGLNGCLPVLTVKGVIQVCRLCKYHNREVVCMPRKKCTQQVFHNLTEMGETAHVCLLGWELGDRLHPSGFSAILSPISISMLNQSV